MLEIFSFLSIEIVRDWQSFWSLIAILYMFLQILLFQKDFRNEYKSQVMFKWLLTFAFLFLYFWFVYLIHNVTDYNLAFTIFAIVSAQANHASYFLFAIRDDIEEKFPLLAP